MPHTSTHIEFLPAGEPDEAVNYEEAEVELEYDFQPAEAAVMDVNSPFAGPGCAASADLIEDSIRRTDGEPVCDALLAAVKAWWERHGEEDAIERGEESRATRRGRMAADPCG
jgi:hypothetical protein